MEDFAVNFVMDKGSTRGRRIPLRPFTSSPHQPQPLTSPLRGLRDFHHLTSPTRLWRRRHPLGVSTLLGRTAPLPPPRANAAHRQPDARSAIAVKRAAS
jgi:hypothetical protein